jgi:16S rRNA (guanine527-N7)-methyltransferase
LADFVSRCAHLVRQDGVLLAMKGQYPDLELAQLGDTATVTAVHRLEVPGLSEQRHVVELRPESGSCWINAG